MAKDKKLAAHHRPAPTLRQPRPDIRYPPVPWANLYTPLTPMLFSPNGGPYFMHPLAQPPAFKSKGNGMTEATDNTSSSITRTATQNQAGDDKLAELKLSQAAKQLKGQVDEAIAVFVGFRAKYDKEINPIKRYASKGLLLQIWQEKIRGNANTPQGQKTLKRQLDKLRISLEAVHEAAIAFMTSKPTGNACDSRQIQLEKVHQAKGRIGRLARVALFKEEVFNVLVLELKELERLLNPKIGAAKVLYQFAGAEVGEKAEDAGKDGDDNGDDGQEEDNNGKEGDQEDGNAGDDGAGHAADESWQNSTADAAGGGKWAGF